MNLNYTEKQIDTLYYIWKTYINPNLDENQVKGRLRDHVNQKGYDAVRQGLVGNAEAKRNIDRINREFGGNATTKDQLEEGVTIERVKADLQRQSGQTQSKCNLRFDDFIRQVFANNGASQLIELLNMEGKDVQMVTKLRTKISPDEEVMLFKWNDMQEVFDMYKALMKGEKTHEASLVPTIDLHLLYLMITARDAIKQKGLSLCDKDSYKVPSVDSSRLNKTDLRDYQINIRDGGDYANPSIRQTFKDMIKMIDSATRGSEIRQSFAASPYQAGKFIYTE